MITLATPSSNILSGSRLSINPLRYTASFAISLSSNSKWFPHGSPLLHQTLSGFHRQSTQTFKRLLSDKTRPHRHFTYSADGGSENSSYSSTDCWHDIDVQRVPIHARWHLVWDKSNNKLAALHHVKAWLHLRGMSSFTCIRADTNLSYDIPLAWLPYRTTHNIKWSLPSAIHLRLLLCFLWYTTGASTSSAPMSRLLFFPSTRSQDTYLLPSIIRVAWSILPRLLTPSRSNDSTYSNLTSLCHVVRTEQGSDCSWHFITYQVAYLLQAAYSYKSSSHSASHDLCTTEFLIQFGLIPNDLHGYSYPFSVGFHPPHYHPILSWVQ